MCVGGGGGGGHRRNIRVGLYKRDLLVDCYRAQELCEGRGSRLGLHVVNSN